MISTLRCVSGVFFAASASGCLSTPAYLDSTSYRAQFPDADGFVFESDRRLYVLQLMESPMEDDIDPDTIIGYLSIPVYRGEGLEWGDPGFAFGWQSVSLVLTDMFVVKGDESWRSPNSHTKEPPMDPDTEELLRLSVNRATFVPVELTRDIELGRQLEIRGMDAAVGEFRISPSPAVPARD